MRKLLKLLLIAVPIALVVMCVRYVKDYYPADEAAKAALVQDADVAITETDYGMFFDGPSSDSALIFYPGGKVEETAYAPLLRKLAGAGVDVCLVSMPARLAIFGFDRASNAMRGYDYDNWYICGHSLGGVAAGAYASYNSELLKGVIMLASYPVRPVSGTDALFIYGSEDSLLNKELYEKGKKLVPENSPEYIIKGGNHAQFGSYGAQEGDGEALITSDEQIRQTVSAIMDFVRAHSEKIS